MKKKKPKIIVVDGIEWETDGKFKKATKKQLLAASKIKVNKVAGYIEIDPSLYKIKDIKKWLKS